MVDEGLKFEPTRKNYDLFIKTIIKAARKTIPRGCRTKHIPGLTKQLRTLCDEYHQSFEEDPFSAVTLKKGEHLATAISEARHVNWIEFIESINIARDSQKAWKKLKKLSNDRTSSRVTTSVTPDQVANHLLLNGKGKHKVRKPCISGQNLSVFSKPFGTAETTTAIQDLKTGRAAGEDNISTELLKNLGPTAVEWLTDFYSDCLQKENIPSQWRRAKVIAIPKPGKDLSNPANFRPIALLSHLFKLYEKLILKRLNPIVEPQLIDEQAGFRPGKNTTSQVLNLTSTIEEGFEEGKLTGVVLIDLSAAYDTVNHRQLLAKTFNLLNDPKLCRVLRDVLADRSFVVQLDDRKSCRRKQKNGLPQGSVLSPLLFNIFTNDQPLPIGTKSFIYADDRAIAVQSTEKKEVEEKLQSTLAQLSVYYESNNLRPNPSKTETCLFHLNNRRAKDTLEILWEGTPLKHNETPKYLGVTLDRTLSYKAHCTNTRGKVSNRNNMLGLLTNSSWGADPRTVRTTALSLCYSAAEYACPVWYQSSHVRQIDYAINETMRKITGCTRSTRISQLQKLCGIAPASIRRETIAREERLKQVTDKRHPMYGNVPSMFQPLKSRKSFLHHTRPLKQDAPQYRLRKWRLLCSLKGELVSPSEEIPLGSTMKWKEWKTLNRLRAGTGMCKKTLRRIAVDVPAECTICGEEEDVTHLYSCPQPIYPMKLWTDEDSAREAVKNCLERI